MIEKIFFGLSSALVFEGLMLSIFPGRIKELVKIMERTPTSTLALIGLFMISLGIVFLSVIEI